MGSCLAKCLPFLFAREPHPDGYVEAQDDALLDGKAEYDNNDPASLPRMMRVAYKPLSFRVSPSYDSQKLLTSKAALGSYWVPMDKRCVMYNSTPLTFFQVEFTDGNSACHRGWLLDRSPNTPGVNYLELMRSRPANDSLQDKLEQLQAEHTAGNESDLSKRMFGSTFEEHEWFEGNPHKNSKGDVKLPTCIQVIGKNLSKRGAPEYSWSGSEKLSGNDAKVPKDTILQPLEHREFIYTGSLTFTNNVINFYRVRTSIPNGPNGVTSMKGQAWLPDYSPNESIRTLRIKYC